MTDRAPNNFMLTFYWAILGLDYMFYYMVVYFIYIILQWNCVFLASIFVMCGPLYVQSLVQKVYSKLE